MDGLVVGSKVLIMGLLFVLSMVNAHVKFVAEKPRKFLGEGLLIGSMSAIAFAFIALIRGVGTDKVLHISVISFLLFFVFHIFMEFSGFNQGAINPKKLGGKQQKQMEAFKSRPAIYVFVILGAVMALVALINRDMTTGMGDNLSILQLSLEGLVFSVLNAMPTVMLAIDRGEKSGKKIVTDTAVMGAAFFVGHVLLQLGGFYTSAFST